MYLLWPSNQPKMETEMLAGSGSQHPSPLPPTGKAAMQTRSLAKTAALLLYATHQLTQHTINVIAETKPKLSVRPSHSLEPGAGRNIRKQGVINTTNTITAMPS